MRFLCLYKPAKEEGTPPQPEEIATMGKLIEEMTKAGVLLATEGCQPSAKGARIRLNGGKFTVIDGPFTETKGGMDQALPRSGGRRRERDSSGVRHVGLHPHAAGGLTSGDGRGGFSSTFNQN